MSENDTHRYKNSTWALNNLTVTWGNIFTRHEALALLLRFEKFFGL